MAKKPAAKKPAAKKPAPRKATPKKVKADATPTPAKPKISDADMKKAMEQEQPEERRNLAVPGLLLVIGIMLVAMLLAGCSGGSVANVLTPEPIKAKQDRAAICEWTKKSGLPITLQSRKEIPGKWRTGGAFRDAYLADVKTVVGTNLKQECYCGSPQRRLTLRCDELEAAPQEG